MIHRAGGYNQIGRIELQVWTETLLSNWFGERKTRRVTLVYRNICAPITELAQQYGVRSQSGPTSLAILLNLAIRFGQANFLPFLFGFPYFLRRGLRPSCRFRFSK